MDIPSNDFKKFIQNGLALLTDLGQFYTKATLEAKSKLIGSIFTEKLIYDRKIYRTSKINEAVGWFSIWTRVSIKTAPKKIRGCPVRLPLLDLNQRPSD
jgi:hypothetical protein